MGGFLDKLFKGKRLSREEISWILYDVGNSAFVLIVVTSIMPIYYKDYAATGFSSDEANSSFLYANTVASVIVAVLAPILGSLGDYRNGKKRFLGFFMLMGVVFTFAFIFIGQGMWLTALLLYVIATVGFAGSNVFYDSLLVDVAENERMDMISAHGYAWGYVGSTIPFIIAIAVMMLGGNDNKIATTRIAFAITGVWWLFFSLPILFKVEQKYSLPGSETPIRDSFLRLWNTFREIRRYRNVLLFIIAYFFYIDGVDTIIKAAVIYGKDIGLNSMHLLIVVLAIQFVAFPFALIFGKFAEIFTTKIMLFAGIGIYLVIVLVGFFLPVFESHNIRFGLFCLLALLVASAQGGIQALSRSFFSKIIPKEKSAEFFGFYNIFGKFATIAGPGLMGLANQLTGELRYGILSLAILFLIGGGLLFAVKPQTNF